MDVSVVILTWNSKTFVKNCLDSVFAQMGVTMEVIVVDNGSTDGTLELLEEYDLKLIKNKVNAGVATARNQGINVAQADYIYILDIDTVMEPGSLDKLVRFMEANPKVGLAGSKLLYPDGEIQLSCRNFPTLSSKFLRRIPVNFAKNMLAKETYRFWDHATPRPVGYVIGASQIIRRWIFDDVGYLDGKIFYGPEDVDFCLRIWKRGMEVWYIPDAQVIHYEQRITKKLFSRITWLHIKGLAYYFVKHRYLLSIKALPKIPEIADTKTTR